MKRKTKEINMLRNKSKQMQKFLDRSINNLREMTDNK